MLVGKDILPLQVCQLLVNVQAGTVDAKKRLGQEGGLEVMLCCNGLDDVLGGHQTIGNF